LDELERYYSVVSDVENYVEYECCDNVEEEILSLEPLFQNVKNTSLF
jgi:hypothetical protein